MDSLNVIDNPHNRKVVATLLAVHYVFAGPNAEDIVTTPTFSTEFDLSALRTHPDLGSALDMAAIGLPHTAGLILGYQVLVNSTGVIFALAMSMHFMAMRIPAKDNQPAAHFFPARPDIDFGNDWMTVNPWDQASLHRILAKSLAYADQLT